MFNVIFHRRYSGGIALLFLILFAFGSQGFEWEDATPEQFPTREQVLEYMNEMQTRVEAWLKGMKDSDLLSPDTSFDSPPRMGGSVLGRAMYLLRHSQHHLGELNGELRRRELPRAEWR